jgi:hypothetical protein
MSLSKSKNGRTVPLADALAYTWKNRQSRALQEMRPSASLTAGVGSVDIEIINTRLNCWRLLRPSWEQHDARIEVARLGARDIVEATWSSIQAVAEELLRKKTLNAADVKVIVLRCERELDSS